MLTPGTVKDLAGFFRADQICTSLSSAITVELTESPDAAHNHLKSENFDQAPVMHAGRPIGWVMRKSLVGRDSVRSCMTALEACTLVSAESSIARVLPLLMKDKFLFVIGAGEVQGFIVPSDRDRHAVRSYLYLLIAGIEMQLAEIVKLHCTEKEMTDEMGGRLKKVFDVAREHEQETSAVEYLYLKSLIKLFKGKNFEQHMLWNDDLSSLLDRIESFRNDVMHANKSLAASGEAASIGDLPSWATKVSDSLQRIISFRRGLV